jgi:hypothetical protein
LNKKKNDPYGLNLIADLKKKEQMSATLALEPWPDPIVENNTADATARWRWRKALKPVIEMFKQDFRHTGELHIRNRQKINAMVRAITFVDPGILGRSDTMPPTWLWAGVSNKERTNFQDSKASETDRKDLIRFLGRFAARVNWKNNGDASAPILVSAVTDLFFHWTAMIWTQYEFPDWCNRTTVDNNNVVFPHCDTDGWYRPKESTLDDMHTFLLSWQEERASMGRKQMRRGINPAKNCEKAAVMGQLIVLLRALAVSYPDSINPEDISIIKKIGSIINTPDVEKNVASTVRALEDKLALEEGLQRIPDSKKTEEPARKRAL